MKLNQKMFNITLLALLVMQSAHGAASSEGYHLVSERQDGGLSLWFSGSGSDVYLLKHSVQQQGRFVDPYGLLLVIPANPTLNIAQAKPGEYVSLLMQASVINSSDGGIGKLKKLAKDHGRPMGNGLVSVPDGEARHMITDAAPRAAMLFATNSNAAPNSVDVLRQQYKAIFDQAVKNRLQTIVLPLLDGYDLQEMTDAAVQALADFKFRVGASYRIMFVVPNPIQSSVFADKLKARFR